MTPAQNTIELINTINSLYAKNDKSAIIEKTMISIEMGLALGCNTGFMCTRMIDLGVKPQELGLAVVLALKNADDSILCETDRIIKKEASRIMETVN